MFQAELAKYYDLMRQYRDYDQECRFADSIIQKYRPGTRKVLDICCGTGAHALRMARLGYEVTGVDLSPDMLDIARGKAKRADLPIDLRCIDVRKLNEIEVYQAAYCLGYTFLYMTKYSEVMSFFETVNRTLSVGGVFLLDFINGWSLIEEFQQDHFVYEDENTTITHHEKSSLDKKKRVKHIEFNYSITNSDGQVKNIIAREDLRIFFDDEVQMLLAQGGFDNIASFGDYSIEKQKSEVPYIIAIAGRKMK